MKRRLSDYAAPLGIAFIWVSMPLLMAASFKASPGAYGNKVHPTSSTDNAIARYDGTTGDLQNSGITVSDSDALTIPADSAEITAADGTLNLGANIQVTSTVSVSGGGLMGTNGFQCKGSLCNLYDASNNALVQWKDDGTTGGVAYTPEAFTIADNTVGASPATSTDLPVSRIILATCSDADGCDWTPTETSATNGIIVDIVNVGANTLTIKHSAGAVLLNGGTDEALGQYDNLRLTYSSTASAWIQLGATGNN